MGMSYRSKPDMREPWRYVCPNCERQVHRSRGSIQYWCQHCQLALSKDELWDKRGDERPPRIVEVKDERFRVAMWAGKFKCPVDGCKGTTETLEGVRYHMQQVHKF